MIFSEIFHSRMNDQLKIFKSLILGLGVLICSVQAATAQRVPNSNVSARYDIRINGFNLGEFRFNSRLKNGRYNFSSRANVSILGGLAYTWEASSSAKGHMTRGRPKPAKYEFRFKDSKKSGQIRMSYARGLIKNLTVRPNSRSRSTVPVTRSHMNSGLDPLSALLVLTRKGRSHKSVCRNRVPVFDGKVRFDLVLSYKKSARISASQSGGYSGPLIVCKARYIPISGHKPRAKMVRFMKKTKGIELWLMPLPKSTLYAPYQIVVPTQIGRAVAISTRFEMRRRGGRNIALVQ